MVTVTEIWTGGDVSLGEGDVLSTEHIFYFF